MNCFDHVLFRLSLRATVRAAGKHPTITKQTEIALRRGRLRSKIVKHQHQAALYLDISPEEVPEDYEDISDSDILPDADFDSESDEPVSNDEPQIEDFKITLPSSVSNIYSFHRSLILYHHVYSHRAFWSSLAPPFSTLQSPQAFICVLPDAPQGVGLVSRPSCWQCFSRGTRRGGDSHSSPRLNS
jgi:hypothetical protein